MSSLDKRGVRGGTRMQVRFYALVHLYTNLLKTLELICKAFNDFLYQAI